MKNLSGLNFLVFLQHEYKWANKNKLFIAKIPVRGVIFWFMVEQKRNIAFFAKTLPELSMAYGNR